MIQEKIDPITLSQAMRKGMGLYSPCVGRLYEFTDASREKVQSCCALGAVYEGIDKFYEDRYIFRGTVEASNKLGKLYPELYELEMCPDCASEHYELLSEMITHLNDDHRWTRERIADWLESIDL